MATGDLTTLAVVKGYLPGLDPTDTQYDVLLARLITAVSLQFANDINRDLAAATGIVEVFDGDGRQRITPRNYPITSVTSLVINGSTIPVRPSTVETGYFLDGQTSVCLSGYLFTKGAQNVVLTYSAGYATIPLDVEQAMVKMICLQFRDKDRIGQGSRSMQGESVSYSDAPVLAAYRNAVDNYKAPLVS